MSHVDEGTLHAYLDGELSPSERASLEAHLEQCTACKSLLTEERALLERATALLGSTRPAERPVPPFQEVQRAQRRPSPWYARRTFAWAASLVLAVGLGYYIRGSSPSSAPSLPELPAVVAQGRETAATERDELVAARPTNKARRSAAPASAVAQAPKLMADSLGYAAAPPVTLRGAAPRPDTAVAHKELANALEEANVTVAPAPPAAAAGRTAAAAAPSASRDDIRSVRNLLSTTWPLISRGKAASMLGDRPVGVPGLATRRIRGSPGTDSTVVVEQALDSNTVIQIFQRPATAASNNESLERERAVLARYVGRLRVEITGPVSTDSLNKLLEQVEPLP